MLKILIAEDDRDLRQLFSRVLMKNGYTVRGVSKMCIRDSDNSFRRPECARRHTASAARNQPERYTA